MLVLERKLSKTSQPCAVPFTHTLIPGLFLPTVSAQRWDNNDLGIQYLDVLHRMARQNKGATCPPLTGCVKGAIAQWISYVFKVNSVTFL